MNVDQLHDTVKRIESATGPDADLAAAVLASIKSVLPGKNGETALAPGLLESTDAALHLISLKVPGWSVVLQGYAHEPDGPWNCTIREGTVRDDDELIGYGSGPTPALAALAALLRLLAVRTSGSW